MSTFDNASDNYSNRLSAASRFACYYYPLYFITRVISDHYTRAEFIKRKVSVLLATTYHIFYQREAELAPIIRTVLMSYQKGFSRAPA